MSSKGPFIALWGDNNRPMMKINVQIVTDHQGIFIGVLHDGKVISIDEWNKRFRKQSPR